MIRLKLQTALVGVPCSVAFAGETTGFREVEPDDGGFGSGLGGGLQIAQCARQVVPEKRAFAPDEQGEAPFNGGRILEPGFLQRLGDLRMEIAAHVAGLFPRAACFVGLAGLGEGAS